jgi:hypothetical protein
MIGFNGGLIGKNNPYIGGNSSPGVWTLQERAIRSLGFNATGGDTVSTFTDINGITYRLHIFTTVGNSTFTVTNPGTVEYLVIGGGGGGGGYIGAGGGAGGYRCSVSGDSSGGNTSAESPLTLATGNYTVTVGAGGAGGAATNGPTGVGGNGLNSVFSTITSTGGGGGGPDGRAGVNGGSGGGSGDQFLSAGTGISGQGFGGGIASNSGPERGGGGGGAGAAGATGASSGNGGDGLISTIDNTGTRRGGGGGGASYNAPLGLGGLGGGGNGGDKVTGQAGSPNTGGGGGSGGSSTASNFSQAGGNGGSGVVIIRYPI